jgi:DNA topoisomerase-3
MAPVKCLFVAEKNSVAKAIVQALGGGNRVHGPSQMNPITECKGMVAALGQQQEQSIIRVTSVQGHLMEMDFKGSNRKWGGCPPVDLFDAEVEKFVPEKFKDNEKQLKEQARWADWLVLWLDCDREGENIAFEVIHVCTSMPGGKPKAQLRLLRAKFSDVERSSVLRACTTLAAPNKQDADAVDARSELDLRTGAAFTR